jgi:hypothetical protein
MNHDRLREILMWVSPVIALIGSVGGSYIGVNVAIVKLESAVVTMKDEIKALQIAEAEYARPRSGYIQKLEDHDRRLTIDEADIKANSTQVQQNTSDIAVLKSRGK